MKKCGITGKLTAVIIGKLTASDKFSLATNQPAKEKEDSKGHMIVT